MGPPGVSVQQGPGLELRSEGVLWLMLSVRWLLSVLQTVAVWRRGLWSLYPGLAEMKRRWGGLWSGRLCLQWLKRAVEEWCSVRSVWMKGCLEQLMERWYQAEQSWQLLHSCVEMEPLQSSGPMCALCALCTSCASCALHLSQFLNGLSLRSW